MTPAALGGAHLAAHYSLGWHMKQICVRVPTARTDNMLHRCASKGSDLACMTNTAHVLSALRACRVQCLKYLVLAAMLMESQVRRLHALGSTSWPDCAACASRRSVLLHMLLYDWTHTARLFAVTHALQQALCCSQPPQTCRWTLLMHKRRSPIAATWRFRYAQHPSLPGFPACLPLLST